MMLWRGGKVCCYELLEADEDIINREVLVVCWQGMILDLPVPSLTFLAFDSAGDKLVLSSPGPV